MFIFQYAMKNEIEIPHEILMPYNLYKALPTLANAKELVKAADNFASKSGKNDFYNDALMQKAQATVKADENAQKAPGIKPAKVAWYSKILGAVPQKIEDRNKKLARAEQ